MKSKCHQDAWWRCGVGDMSHASSLLALLPRLQRRGTTEAGLGPGGPLPLSQPWEWGSTHDVGYHLPFEDSPEFVLPILFSPSCPSSPKHITQSNLGTARYLGDNLFIKKKETARFTVDIWIATGRLLEK